MPVPSLRALNTRLHTRLRLAALVVLLGLAGLTAGGVLAGAPAGGVPTSASPGAADTAAPALASPVPAPAASANTQVQPQRFGVREMFAQADLVVKAVMVFLFFCSLLTWAVLFEKLWVFARARRANNRFLQAFRKGEADKLDTLADGSAMARMWQVGQAELKHFRRNRAQEASADQINRLLQRMSLSAGIVQERDLARLGSMMGVLATIGATAPFIGLFGTVWGILNSFANIATMKSSSLAIVAPGIAEALLATALGLFAAIPAVMIFNKFARDINGFVGALDNFSAEMIAAMSRQLDEVR
ncbi:MAG: MotA/TolQ/ExbB proton channel family protein [Pseudomonadota bacterium]